MGKENGNHMDIRQIIFDVMVGPIPIKGKISIVGEKPIEQTEQLPLIPTASREVPPTNGDKPLTEPMKYFVKTHGIDVTGMKFQEVYDMIGRIKKEEEPVEEKKPAFGANTVSYGQGSNEPLPWEVEPDRKRRGRPKKRTL